MKGGTLKQPDGVVLYLDMKESRLRDDVRRRK